jgi:hypothetical protein
MGYRLSKVACDAFHGDGSSKDANDECAASELKTWNEVVGALLLS